jgi:hypothetical protein
MNVASFAPSIMVSIAIALSIDYSLFLLTRYREEKLKLLEKAEIAAQENAYEQSVSAGHPSDITVESLVASAAARAQRQNYLACVRDPHCSRVRRAVRTCTLYSDARRSLFF